MSNHATKIVATLGPASSDPALLEAMIKAGVNVVRLNFSHGKAQDHVDRAALVREAAKRAGRVVAIMADLQGPKIRVGKFADGKVMLENGAKFVLDASRTEPGNLHDMVVSTVEKPLLEVVMKHADDNQSRAAQWLGLNRNTLRKKLTEHKLL